MKLFCTFSMFYFLCFAEPNSILAEEINALWIYNSPILQVVGPTEREAIARIHCCIMILAECRMLIYDTSIVAAHEASLNYSVGIPFYEIIVKYYDVISIFKI